MLQAQLTRILKAHSIDYTVNGGQTIAVEEYTLNGVSGSNSVNVTGWTLRKLKDWLGY